jgi:hypothetical protein
VSFPEERMRLKKSGFITLRFRLKIITYVRAIRNKSKSIRIIRKPAWHMFTAFQKSSNLTRTISYNSGLSWFLSPFTSILVCCERIDVCHFRSKNAISLHNPTLKKGAISLSPKRGIFVIRMQRFFPGSKLPPHSLPWKTKISCIYHLLYTQIG